MVGLSAVASVKYQLDQIRAAGFLSKTEGKQRAMDVVRPLESKTGTISDGNAKSIPVVGRIAAGIPITAEQNVEDVFTLPAQLVGKSDDLFILKVHGESMIDAAICDGDWVVVRAQQTAENGDIVAALLEEEATVIIVDAETEHKVSVLSYLCATVQFGVNWVV